MPDINAWAFASMINLRYSRTVQYMIQRENGMQKTSDSQLYKQAGNGVTVEVIHKIGKQFKEA